MKEFYDKKDNNSYRFWEIYIPEDGLSIEIMEGKYWDSTEYLDGKNKSKKFKTKEETKKYYEKQVKKKIKEGYQLSDINFPLCVKDEIERVKKNHEKSIRLYIQSIDAIKEVCQLIHLEELELFFSNIYELPDEISNLINLKKLNIVSELKSFSSGLEKLTNLEELKYEARVEMIPGFIGKMTKFKVLNLSNNNLTNLTDEFFQLLNLEELILDNNNFVISKKLGNLKNLTKLDLSWNKITKLPDKLFHSLNNLTNLILEHNKIEKLPDSIFELTNLTHLNLESNKITHISEKILNLTKLEKIDTTDNPIENIPDEMDSTKDQIFNHFLYSTKVIKKLYQSIKKGSLDGVKKSIKNKGILNIHFDEITPLYTAIQAKKPKIISFLLEQGADPNMRNDDWEWNSPLDKACNLKLIQELVSKGADINSKNRNGHNVLHALLSKKRKNNIDIVKYYLENGIDVEIKTLMDIVESLDIEIAKLLTPKVNDINKRMKNRFNKTPLEYLIHTLRYDTANQSTIELIEILIENGADVNLNDENGVSPIMHAFYDKQSDVVDLLLNNNAREYDINPENFISSFEINDMHYQGNTCIIYVCFPQFKLRVVYNDNEIYNSSFDTIEEMEKAYQDECNKILDIGDWTSFGTSRGVTKVSRIKSMVGEKMKIIESLFSNTNNDNQESYEDKLYGKYLIKEILNELDKAAVEPLKNIIFYWDESDCTGLLINNSGLNGISEEELKNHIQNSNYHVDGMEMEFIISGELIVEDFNYDDDLDSIRTKVSEVMYDICAQLEAYKCFGLIEVADDFKAFSVFHEWESEIDFESRMKYLKKYLNRIGK